MGRPTDEEILQQAAQILARRHQESGDFISNMFRQALHRSRSRERRDNGRVLFGTDAQIRERTRRRREAEEGSKNETGK